MKFLPVWTMSMQFSIEPERVCIPTNHKWERLFLHNSTSSSCFYSFFLNRPFAERWGDSVVFFLFSLIICDNDHFFICFLVIYTYFLVNCLVLVHFFFILFVCPCMAVLRADSWLPVQLICGQNGKLGWPHARQAPHTQSSKFLFVLSLLYLVSAIYLGYLSDEWSANIFSI